MTWASDAANGRPEGLDRDKLLLQRKKLIKELEDLNLRPKGKTVAAQKYDAEDQMKLAAKIVAIDKKLGRI